MPKPEPQPLTLPAPRSRDYAEGFCDALRTLSHSINFATVRCAKKELAGLEAGFDLAKRLYDAMRTHLDAMTGEAVPPQTPEGPANG
jgi:hypothetical protein